MHSRMPYINGMAAIDFFLNAVLLGKIKFSIHLNGLAFHLHVIPHFLPYSLAHPFLDQLSGPQFQRQFHLAVVSPLTTVVKVR